MNRLFQKLIFYCVACHYFIVFTINETSQISLASTSNETKHPVKSQPKTNNQNTINHHVTIPIGKKSNNNFVLVPPPPPEQPSFLDWSNIDGFSTSLDLYSKEELKQKLMQAKKQIINALKRVDENNKQLIEAKDKAENFKSLYTEGVVSHKELEAAEKNITDKESSAQEAQGKLADLQIQEKAILRRLEPKKKGDISKKYRSKNKVVKHEKQQ